jgi:hypothetical protein
VSARELTAGGRRWRFVPDEPPPDLLQRVQAVVDLAVTDEQTAAPPATPLRITTTRSGLAPRIGPDGRIGLVGRPAEILPPALVPGSVIPVEVGAAGYLAHAIEVTLQAPPQPTLPLALHREPVAVWGRVLDISGGAPVPVAGATVRLIGVEVLALAQGLYAPRADAGPAAARIRRRELTPTGTVLMLLDGAGAGATRLRLSSRQGLTVPVNPVSPDILMIDPGDAERLEALRVTAVEGSLAADEPATVTLAHPLRRTHRAGVTVRLAAASPVGPDMALTSPAIAGDVTLPVVNASGFALVDFVEIESAGGTPATEHQLLQRLFAVTDAAGRFRLPPLHRLGTLTLEVTAGAVIVTRTVDLVAGPLLPIELRIP